MDKCHGRIQRVCACVCVCVWGGGGGDRKSQVAICFLWNTSQSSLENEKDCSLKEVCTALYEILDYSKNNASSLERFFWIGTWVLKSKPHC